jgi:hypothetical protein
MGTDPRIRFDRFTEDPLNSREIEADKVQSTMERIHKLLPVEMRRSQHMISKRPNKKQLSAPEIKQAARV